MTIQEREHKEKCLRCKYHGFIGQSTMKQYKGNAVKYIYIMYVVIIY